MAGTTWWWGWTPRPCVYIPSAYTIQYNNQRRGREKKKKKKPIDSHYTRAQQERLRPPGVSVYIVYKVAGQPLTSSLFFTLFISLVYCLQLDAVWPLFLRGSAGLFCPYPPLSLQHYCPTFALYHSNFFFFSSLLFVPLHVACYVRRWRRPAGTFPIGNQRPANPWSIVPRLLAGCLFVFPPPLYTGRRTLHTLDCRWTDSGEREGTIHDRSS